MNALELAKRREVAYGLYAKQEAEMLRKQHAQLATMGEALTNANKRIEQLEKVLAEWLYKTEWVQKNSDWQELGMHRADALKRRVEQLERENATIEKHLQEIQRMCLGYQEEHAGLRKDAEMLDWLNQNFFHREMSDFDARIFERGEKYNQWVFFAPKNVQGDIRNVLDAAMKGQA